MKAQVKINPVRLRVPRYGNGLMLLMEWASKYQDTGILGVVSQHENYFDVCVRMTAPCAQSIKKYINDNL